MHHQVKKSLGEFPDWSRSLRESSKRFGYADALMRISLPGPGRRDPRYPIFGQRSVQAKRDIPLRQLIRMLQVSGYNGARSGTG